MNIVIQLAIFFFWSCSTKKISADEEISGVKIISNFPVLDIRDSQINIVRYDTFETRIYKYRNQLLIMSSYGFMKGASFKNADKDNTPLVTEIRHKYFLYSPGEKTGLLFDTTKNIFKKHVDVDSMIGRLQKEILTVRDLERDVNMSLRDSKKNVTNVDLIETYIFTAKKDSAMKGTIFFHFTDPKKFNGSDFSLSKELDSLRQMKLYKIVTITDARFMGPPNNAYMDRAESFYLLEPVSDFEDVKKYFNNKHQD